MSIDAPPRDAFEIRNLEPSDLDAMVAIDARNVGRRREEFFRLKLKQALADTGIAMSLAVVQDGALIGFALARVYYGEFGVTERVAVLDVIDVHPDFRGRGAGAALVDQLRTNLLALGIQTLQTEVSWEDQDLLSFFRRERFRVAQRLCLDLDLPSTRI